MKLYTEKQLIYAIQVAFDVEPPCKVKDILRDLTPIELPIDEEIEEASNNLGYGSRSVGIIHNAFQVGAKWMRDKIKGGGQWDLQKKNN